MSYNRRDCVYDNQRLDSWKLNACILLLTFGSQQIVNANRRTSAEHGGLAEWSDGTNTADGHKQDGAPRAVLE